MKHLIQALALLATACGAQEPTLPQAQDEAPRNTRQMPIPQTTAANAPEAWWSLKAQSPDHLPECTPETEGRLAWVVSEKTAFACSEAAWYPLDLKGRDGKDGQSIVGERGEKGEKGDKGEQGVAGADGADGSDGVDGINGRDGVDGITTTITQIQRNEDLPKVRDANGTLIGDLFYYDNSRNHFLAVTPSGLRVRFTSLGGIPDGNVYYKTANCSDNPAVIAHSYSMESLFRVHDGYAVKDGALVNESRAYRRRGFGEPCEVAPSVVTARFYSLRAMTQAEAADVWNYGLAYVD